MTFRFRELEFSINQNDTKGITIVQYNPAGKESVKLILTHRAEATVKPRYRAGFSKVRKIEFADGQAEATVVFGEIFAKPLAFPVNMVARLSESGVEASVVVSPAYEVVSEENAIVEVDDVPPLGVGDTSGEFADLNKLNEWFWRIEDRLTAFEQRIGVLLPEGMTIGDVTTGLTDIIQILPLLKSLADSLGLFHHHHSPSATPTSLMEAVSTTPGTSVTTIANCPYLDLIRASLPATPSPSPTPSSTNIAPWAWTDIILVNGSQDTVTVQPSTNYSRLQWRVYNSQVQFRGNVIPGAIDPGSSDRTLPICFLGGLNMTSTVTVDATSSTSDVSIDFLPQSDGTVAVRARRAGIQLSPISFENIGFFI